MYRSIQRTRVKAEDDSLSRDSFSVRCHRRTSRKRLYWNCQTVRISSLMLVRRTEQNRKREKTRKQMIGLVEKKRKGYRVFSHKIYFHPRVTFDIDVNSVLVEKQTNKKKKIMITNDKECLSRESSERMVNEAERYHIKNDKQRKRVVVKNNFESYCFNMKSTIEKEKVKRR